MSLPRVLVRLDRHWPVLSKGIDVWDGGLVSCRSPLNFSCQWTPLLRRVIFYPKLSVHQHMTDMALIWLIGLTWTWLLVGAVKSCSLTLWPLFPKGSPVIGHFLCTSVLWSTAGCERVHPQAAGLAGGCIPDEGWRRQVTTALLYLEVSSSRQMPVGVTGQHIYKDRLKLVK